MALAPQKWKKRVASYMAETSHTPRAPGIYRCPGPHAMRRKREARGAPPSRVLRLLRCALREVSARCVADVRRNEPRRVLGLNGPRMRRAQERAQLLCEPLRVFDSRDFRRERLRRHRLGLLRLGRHCDSSQWGDADCVSRVTLYQTQTHRARLRCNLNRIFTNAFCPS